MKDLDLDLAERGFDVSLASVGVLIKIPGKDAHFFAL